jgi:hypothetical protein
MFEVVLQRCRPIGDTGPSAGDGPDELPIGPGLREGWPRLARSLGLRLAAIAGAYGLVTGLIQWLAP